VRKWCVPRPPRQEKLTWSLLKAELTRDDALADGIEFSSHIVSPLTTADPSLEVVPFVVEFRDGGPGVMVRR
jgi:hypothetical protein